jgi:hypothetical protein
MQRLCEVQPTFIYLRSFDQHPRSSTRKKDPPPLLKNERLSSFLKQDHPATSFKRLPFLLTFPRCTKETSALLDFSSFKSLLSLAINQQLTSESFAFRRLSLHVVGFERCLVEFGHKHARRENHVHKIAQVHEPLSTPTMYISAGRYE